MFRFIASRFLQAIIALVCVLTLTFVLSRFAPGSAFEDERKIPEHILEQQREALGLNKPIIVQWAKNIGNAAAGFPQESWGNSGFTVREVILQALPVSFAIGIAGLLIALALGIPIGMIAAARRNTAVDYSAMSLALVGICLPTFVIGPLLSAFFGIHLRWFNALGWNGPTDWVLPSLVLGLFYAAYIARLSRGGMLEMLSQDFVRTARAKGLPEWRVLVIHTLRGGMLPVVNYLGPAFASLLGGSFVIESIFQLPGLGTHFINAARNRDEPLIQGTVIVFAILILLLNFLADVVSVLLNPRLRTADKPIS